MQDRDNIIVAETKEQDPPAEVIEGKCTCQTSQTANQSWYSPFFSDLLASPHICTCGHTNVGS